MADELKPQSQPDQPRIGVDEWNAKAQRHAAADG